MQLLTASLPLYAVRLGADDAALGLLSGIVAMTSLVSRPWAGVWIDSRGARPAFIAGIAIYLVAAAGYLVARSVDVLIASRALTGVAVALFATSGQALVVSLTAQARWASSLSLYTVAYPIAQMMSPPAGVVLAGAAGYRVLFLACLASGAVALGLALRLTAPPLPQRLPRRRWFHGAILTPGLLLAALNVAFGAAFAFMAVHASRRGLGNPGVVFTAQAFAFLTVLLALSRVSDRLNPRRLILAGLAATALGMEMLAVADGWQLLPSAVLFGAGFGVAQTAIYVVALGQVPADERGSAMATLGVFLEVGVIAGALGGGVVARAFGTPAMFALAGACAAAAAGSVGLLNRGRAASAD